MIYTDQAELNGNTLKPWDTVQIGKNLGRVNSQYIDFWSDHTDVCRSMDLEPIARRVYNDTTDMKWAFPQYKNMRDATNIAQELMRQYSITQYPEYRSLHERMADESRMDDKVKALTDIEKRPESDMFPCAPDSLIDTMREKAMMTDWTCVSYMDIDQISEKEFKKKYGSRLSFSKIK